MKRNIPLWISIAIDVLVLLVTLAASIWISATPRDRVEAILNLDPSFEMPDFRFGTPFGVTPEQQAEARRPLREKYARRYPGSPIAWINGIPAVVRIEKSIARLQASSLPFLAVASIGVGFVAIRRAGPRPGRRRWGAGKVSAAIAMVVCGLEMGNEYALRHWRYNLLGDYHFDLSVVWLQILLHVGPAIAMAWAILLVSGRFRLGRGWREWLGLALGTAWVLDYGWQLVEPLAQVYEAN